MLLDVRFTIPGKTKVQYKPSPDNYVIITRSAKVPNFIWNEETQNELRNKTHLKTIKMARFEYEQGKVVTEEEIFAKLK